MKGEGLPSPFTHFCHDHLVKLFGHAREVRARAKEVVAEYDAHGPHVAGPVRQAIGTHLVAGLLHVRNPYGGRSRPGIYSQLIGTLVALAFVGMGVYLYSMSSTGGGTATTGTVIQVITYSGDSTCSLRAEFSVGGESYQAGAGHSSSGFCSMNVGDNVEIHYDPADPTDAAILDTTLVWLIAIFPVVGLLVLAWSLIGLGHSTAALLYGRRLVRTGSAMSAAHLPVPTDHAVVGEAVEKFTSAVTLTPMAQVRHTA